MHTPVAAGLRRQSPQIEPLPRSLGTPEGTVKGTFGKKYTSCHVPIDYATWPPQRFAQPSVVGCTPPCSPSKPHRRCGLVQGRGRWTAASGNRRSTDAPARFPRRAHELTETFVARSTLAGRYCSVLNPETNKLLQKRTCWLASIGPFRIQGLHKIRLS